MGQVFTDKVDVTKLKEGLRVSVKSDRDDTYTGTLRYGDSYCPRTWLVLTDDGNVTFYICGIGGDFCVCVDSVEILDADPAEKMQAEHAEMLAMLDDAAHALTCTDMILQRDVAQDAKALVAKIEKRKDAQ